MVELNWPDCAVVRRFQNITSRCSRFRRNDWSHFANSVGLRRCAAIRRRWCLCPQSLPERWHLPTVSVRLQLGIPLHLQVRICRSTVSMGWRRLRGRNDDALCERRVVRQDAGRSVLHLPGKYEHDHQLRRTLLRESKSVHIMSFEYALLPARCLYFQWKIMSERRSQRNCLEVVE